MLPGSTVDNDLLFVKGEGIFSAFNIDEFVQEDILMSVRVTLCTHSFGDGIFLEWWPHHWQINII